MSLFFICPHHHPPALVDPCLSLVLGKKFDTLQISNIEHSHRNTCLLFSLIIKPKFSIIVTETGCCIKYTHM